MKTYRRESDGLLMIEFGPHEAVNVLAARSLGLIGKDLKFPESDRLGGTALSRPEAWCVFCKKNHPGGATCMGHHP